MSSPQAPSMDEMRKRRLLRFEQQQNSQPQLENSQASKSTTPATAIPITTQSITPSSPNLQQNQKRSYTLSNELYSLLWGTDSSQQTSYEDKLRWIQQEITFKTEKTSTWSLGLLQHHGGPCGVLAALQAEMIRYYYFDDNKSEVCDIVQDEYDVVVNCLLHAMANIISRSSTRDGTVRIILPCKSNWREIVSNSQQHPSMYSNEEMSLFEMHMISKENIVPFLQQHNCYESMYSKEGGIFLFCISLLESRSLHQVKQDMDDCNTTLISQFGHCSQEFLNLLLTGIATSNVFDHTIDLGSNTILKGVTFQPDIGYLTQLEFLRYCSVGYFYKTPTYPIWIIGSTHHFTVLFCLQRDILDYDEHGKAGGENKTRDFVKSVFQCYVDDRSEDHGFVKVGVLSKIMNQLDLSGKIGGEDGVQTLAAILEVNGAGIILWSDFWAIIKPLMLEQKSFFTILQEHDFGGTSAASKPTNDEEFAKQLYEAENKNMQQQQQDDEELARKLQAQWNSEDGNFGSVNSACMDIVPFNAENDNVLVLSPPPLEHIGDVAIGTSNLNSQESQKKDAISSTVDDKCMDLAYSDDEKDDTPMIINNDNNKDSFIVYHYNGLESGILSKFRIIPFPSETTSFTDSNMSTNSSRDLEDVIRTKWPKCKYDWSVNSRGNMNIVRSLID